MDSARVQEALWRLAPVGPAHFWLGADADPRALEDLRSRAPEVRGDLAGRAARKALHVRIWYHTLQLWSEVF